MRQYTYSMTTTIKVANDVRDRLKGQAALAHRTLGTERTGTVRLSPGAFTRSAEIETALEVIAELAREGRGG